MGMTKPIDLICIYSVIKELSNYKLIIRGSDYNGESSKQASLQAGISMLRIIATLGVVFLHINNTLTSNPESYNMTDLQFICFSCGTYLMNWAVPAFLMITGNLLLDPKKEITINTCITKYIKRIFLALFVFGVPYSILEIYIETKYIGISVVWMSIINVITGNSWGHLWYMYALIGIYALLPFLKVFVNHCNKQTYQYILLILYLFIFCIPFIGSIIGLTIAFKLPITVHTIFYVLAGRYLVDYPIKVNRKMMSIAIVILSASICVITYCTYPYAGDFISYYNPIIAAISILIYSLFLNISVDDKYAAILWNIDRLCFGVYLIHPVFIIFVYKLIKITPLSFPDFYLLVPIFWLFFSGISFAGTYIMRKTPVIKNIL